MGLVSDSLTLPLYMINIVGNRRHSHFLSIMEETGTNIYLPTVWTSSPMGLEKEGVVHISGDNFEAIKKTQLYLKKLIAQKVNKDTFYVKILVTVL
jgi:hypothetical protein